MAHKKAGGSTRNGRDSEAGNAWALSVSVANPFWRVASSFVNVVPNSTLALT